jgi:DNA-binding transcriptional regulator YhcF (GntR family)
MSNTSGVFIENVGSRDLGLTDARFGVGESPAGIDSGRKEKHNTREITSGLRQAAVPMAFFHLEKKSRDTYYQQVRAQLIMHLLCSNLKEGEKLPTIRETARMLGINPNTVFKIYRRLEADHLVEVRQGSGAYVCKSLNGTSQFNQDLLKFISETFHQAEARFSFPPRAFANLMYTYISKAGSVDDVYLVTNDDETMDIDVHQLAARFRCRFVPVDIAALENPSPATRQLIRTARGFITTRYHLERVAKLANKAKKRAIEIKRDPRFIADVLQAAATHNVLVIFQHPVTCNHFRDLVFKKLYPEIISNLSFASFSPGGDKKLQEKMRGNNLIYTTPLCYEATKKLAPKDAKVVQIEGWISTESLDNIRAMLLYPANGAKAVPSQPPR